MLLLVGNRSFAAAASIPNSVAKSADSSSVEWECQYISNVESRTAEYRRQQELLDDKQTENVRKHDSLVGMVHSINSILQRGRVIDRQRDRPADRQTER